MIGWNIAAFTIIVVIVVIAILGSFAETAIVGGDGRRRAMGAWSTVTLDLTKRETSWQNALEQADKDERGKLKAVESFAFVDYHDNGEQGELDYGIAIGYAPSFMSTPSKQVSYVFKTEKIADSDPDKVEKRRHLVAAMDAGITRLMETRNSYARMNKNAPYVSQEAYDYLVSSI